MMNNKLKITIEQIPTCCSAQYDDVNDGDMQMPQPRIGLLGMLKLKGAVRRAKDIKESNTKESDNEGEDLKEKVKKAIVSRKVKKIT